MFMNDFQLEELHVVLNDERTMVGGITYQSVTVRYKTNGGENCNIFLTLKPDGVFSISDLRSNNNG